MPCGGECIREEHLARDSLAFMKREWSSRLSAPYSHAPYGHGWNTDRTRMRGRESKYAVRSLRSSLLFSYPCCICATHHQFRGVTRRFWKEPRSTRKTRNRGCLSFEVSFRVFRVFPWLRLRRAGFSPWLFSQWPQSENCRCASARGCHRADHRRGAALCLLPLGISVARRTEANTLSLPGCVSGGRGRAPFWGNRPREPRCFVLRGTEHVRMPLRARR